MTIVGVVGHFCLVRPTQKSNIAFVIQGLVRVYRIPHMGLHYCQTGLYVLAVFAIRLTLVMNSLVLSCCCASEPIAPGL